MYLEKLKKIISRFSPNVFLKIELSQTWNTNSYVFVKKILFYYIIFILYTISSFYKNGNLMMKGSTMIVLVAEILFEI
jgi:hypothetical protein